jgi:hypothetical protein
VNCGAFGTYGAVVVDTSDNAYILSCNHILTVNGRYKTDRAKIVSADAATGKIATPYAYKKLDRNLANQVDCALASMEAYEGQHILSKPAAPTRGAQVTKTGAFTGKTHGTIVDIDADFYIDYSFGTFHFTNQVVIDGKSNKNENDVFATDGDSGSIVFTDTDEAVAMVFAEAGRFAVACRLTEVLKQLELELQAKRRTGSLSLFVNHANHRKEIAAASRSLK